MVIHREVAGIGSIYMVLTQHELSDAYIEQEHIFDVKDVRNLIDEKDDEYFNKADTTRDEVPAHLDEIANVKRSNFNLKVNVASSENVNNALMQKLYNDFLVYGDS